MSSLVCFHKFQDWGCSLLCPISMATMRMDDIMLQTNGCGRAGLEEKLIPDTIWGLDISPVCRVHDIMYQQAEERARRHKDQSRLSAEEGFADGVMSCNLVQLIQQKTSNSFLRWLRLRRAHKYVDAVSLTNVLSVLPENTLVAMGYDTPTQAMGDMIC